MSTRDKNAVYRHIYSLKIELEESPESLAGEVSMIIVSLENDGNPVRTLPNGDGWPAPPKVRTIDLCIADLVFCRGVRRIVKSISVEDETWLSEREVANLKDVLGFIYKPLR